MVFAIAIVGVDVVVKEKENNTIVPLSMADAKFICHQIA